MLKLKTEFKLVKIGVGHESDCIWKALQSIYEGRLVKSHNMKNVWHSRLNSRKKIPMIH